MESDTPETGEYVVVSVRDSGVGIHPEDQQRIFEKFGQVGNVLTDKPQGTGLGLTISGTIMVQHGGALWVESHPGQGSVFAFSIPVASRAVQVAPEPQRDGSGELPHPADELVQSLERTANGQRILVVDDEPSIVAAITELLEPLGYRAIGCTSGSQAVAKARDVRPDAVILDIMMPEINGFDVLRLLKGDPDTAEIPVIVLSVLEDAQRAYELGATEYISKPFDASVLLENVKALA
jgi:CheY-like chemotaxis protein